MMTAPRTLTLADLRNIITDSNELTKGTQIVDAGQLTHLSRFESRIFAEAAGSGAAPYKLSARLDDSLRVRCSCMAARSRPYCKHGAALLVAWSRTPQAFVVGEGPPAEAVGAVSKKAVRRGKDDAKTLMAHGVERAARLVGELGVTGVSGVVAASPERVEQIRALAENLREHRLRRISARTRRLADLLVDEVDASEYTDLMADMLLTVRKLEKHLEREALEPVPGCETILVRRVDEVLTPEEVAARLSRRTTPVTTCRCHRSRCSPALTPCGPMRRPRNTWRAPWRHWVRQARKSRWACCGRRPGGTTTASCRRTCARRG